MKIQDYDHPDNLLYHREFCWINMKEGIATVGLHDFYCKLAGELSFIDMPDKDEQINADERIGTVETGKWIGKLVAPLSGEIIEINEDVSDDPSIVNQSPYDNWLFRMKLSDKSEIDSLMNAENAVPWLEDEIKKHA